MKSKELIYLASTAILLAATANVVQAEENAPTTTDPEVAKAELQVEKDHQPQQVALPEAVSTDRQVKQESSVAKAEASTVYKAPENLAPAASLVKENVPENKASEQAKSAASEAIQNPVKAEQTSSAISASPASKKGSTSFYNAASSSGQTARGNSQAEIKGSTFVDVSSHNGHISVEDYHQLASKGVGGVVVKLTEGTHYTNPYAESQVRNAQAAGLQVSTYAFSHYTSDAEARAEARYYAAFANKLSLPKNTVMVNDMEDPKMQSGINQHTQAWADEMRKQGYANLMYYTSASWVDQNNLRHKGSINTSLFGLDNFWIAQYPAPKLSANDAKNLKYNSRAGAWQFTSQAQLLSGKHVFDQSIDYSGRFTARATLVKQPLTGKISIQNNNPKTGTFDVVVSEVSAPHGVQEVKLPTWSSERGQDDIVWYTATKQANGTYKLTVNAANHKGSTGEYNVHLYYVQGDGKLVGVGGTTTKVSVAKPEGKLTITNNNPKTGTFDVIVSEVSSPQGVREVLLPTWSNDQGQDDIIWHKAQRQTDGTYKFTVRASEHKNSVGDYSVHLYYIQNDGKMVGVGGTTTKVTRASVAKPEGKLTIANNNLKTGTFDVIVSEVSSPQGVREVLLPTWSNDQGQDDIIWHKAQRQTDGTYKFTVRASEHKNSVGDYSVHLYYIQNDGKLVSVGGTTTKVSVAKPEGKLTIANNNLKTGTFDVIVSEVSSPQGVREVLLPTWSNENGQDDIIWHKAQRQSDGTYKFTVRASEHKNSVGDYSVHLYYVQNDGKLVGVGGTTTKVSVAKPEGKLTIANNNPKTGTFDVIVSEVSSPQGVREVLLPTWSNENGQDDIIWHKAQRQSDGTYKFTVRSSEHKNSVGDYSVHLYYIQNDGKLVGVGGTTTKVSVAKPEGKLTIANNDPKTGTFDVIVSEVSSPQGVREVLLPTWSNDQGQDDIIWHKAQRQSDGTYKFTVRSSEHKNSVGDYSVHLYYVQNDGKLVGVGGTTTKVSVAKPEGKLTITNNNPKTGTFDVIVSEVSSPQGVREVLLPTWSNDQGQDDLIWHKAQKQSDGTYKFTVRASEHKNSVGDYSVHLYYVQNDGKLVGVGGTTTKVSIATGEKPQGKISIQNKNNETGEFDIVVSGVVAPEGVKTVYLPTWSSQNGQDDIQWYAAERQADGTYRKHVYARDHKNSQGEYNVHLYYLNNRNQLQGAGGEKTTISIKHPQSPSSQRDRVLAAAAAMVGVKGGSAEHHRLVNDYNSVRPLPVGYAVKNSDDWCDIFTTVIFQREGLSDLIGRECGVERHIHIFKRLGIWNEDGNSTPKAGDIITFNWDQNSQQNDGWADHIGIVEKVENGIIHTIEGNSNDEVKRNTYRIGHGNIRGFASPRYR
nr:GBS Bsp-like repeat-containing protein [uncultured Streptococcus sp.]